MKILFIARSTLRRSATDGRRAAGWTLWRVPAPLSARRATRPPWRRPPRPPPRSPPRSPPLLDLRLIASGASRQRAASLNASSDNLSRSIWWDVQPAFTIGNIQTWWPPQLVWGHKPYPRLQISTTSNSVFRNILGSWCIEMFSQIFSTSISRHRVSLSWQLLTLLYTVANVLKSESDSFFWLLSPDPACYGTPLVVPQNIFQPKISTPYFYIVSFLRCWRWHWWQCWKSLFVGLETSGEVRRVNNNTEQIFLTFLFEDFLTMNFLFEVGLERVQQMYLPDFFKP